MAVRHSEAARTAQMESSGFETAKAAGLERREADRIDESVVVDMRDADWKAG